MKYSKAKFGAEAMYRIRASRDVRLTIVQQEQTCVSSG